MDRPVHNNGHLPSAKLEGRFLSGAALASSQRLPGRSGWLMIGVPVASRGPEIASLGLLGIVPFCRREAFTSGPGDVPDVVPGCPSPVPGVVCPKPPGDVPVIPGDVVDPPGLPLTEPPLVPPDPPPPVPPPLPPPPPL